MKDNEVLSFNHIEDEGIPAWKLLDNAIRKMIARTMHEKQMENYQKLKESYNET